MIRFRRLAFVSTGALAVALSVALSGILTRPSHAQTSSPSAQSPQSWNILVDNVSPANHVYGFDTYYPNNLQAHAGDTISFNIAANPVAFHTVALLPAGTTPEQGFPGFFAPDDDEPGTTLFPFFANEPATPCGRTSQSPCSFDGGSTVNSGILTVPPPPEAGGGQGNLSFTVTLSSNLAPGTYFFECFVHGPTMSGSIDVLPAAEPAQGAADLKADADREYQSDLQTATQAVLANALPTTTSNADGSTTWGIAAGSGAPDTRVSVNEFGVKELVIKAGDAVTWTMGSPLPEVHTVTGFATKPGQEPPELDPFDVACESPGGGPDLLAPETGFPFDLWNTCVGREEAQLNKYASATPPSGSTYSSGDATSGLLLPASALDMLQSLGIPAPFPVSNTYSLKFSQPGAYGYLCTIHPGMEGTIVVTPKQ